MIKDQQNRFSTTKDLEKSHIEKGQEGVVMTHIPRVVSHKLQGFHQQGGPP